MGLLLIIEFYLTNIYKMKASIKEIAVLILVVALGGIALYYYFKFQGVQNDNLDPIEEREEQRTVDIDSIVKERTSKLEDSIADLTDIITKLEKYEPPKVDNSDLPDANSRKLDSIITSYYNR